jgi:hypothetical protein
VFVPDFVVERLGVGGAGHGAGVLSV